MAQIDKPGSFVGDAKSASELLDHITSWHATQKISASDMHRRVRYRGHSDHSYVLWPGVYRPEFTASAASLYGKSREDKRLNLEREMLSEFRTSGATHLNANNIVEVCFTAQHFGMPTRLLDWTMNPLTALFFAVKSRNEAKDGEVIVMDAPKLLPTLPDTPKGIVTMWHPYAVDAIGLSFWHDPKVPDRPALVLPVRPDNQAGRIGQQSSCFTLHMHGTGACTNATLTRTKVPGNTKPRVLDELRSRVNRVLIISSP